MMAVVTFFAEACPLEVEADKLRVEARTGVRRRGGEVARAGSFAAASGARATWTRRIRSWSSSARRALDHWILGLVFDPEIKADKFRLENATYGKSHGGS